jgi:hypothetical protein
MSAPCTKARVQRENVTDRDFRSVSGAAEPRPATQQPRRNALQEVAPACSGVKWRATADEDGHYSLASPP